MKRFVFFLWVFSAGILFASDKPAADPLPISGFEDRGDFSLYVRESPIATIGYTLTRDGHYSRKCVISMSGQTVEYGMDVRADAQGLWTAIDMTAPAGPVSVIRLADRAEFTLKEKKYSVQLTANHLLYDNFGPAFESFMLRRYDLAKGGKQTFSRLVVPQAVLDFEVEYRGTEPRTVRGAETAFRRFDVRLLGLVVEIWADADFRIDMMRVPVQYAVFVRRGFEELMAETPADPLLSKPESKVSRQTIMVPMRDGVSLATDLYLPEAGGKPLPVILIRTPYKKEMQEMEGNYYARRGYAVAIQDCRGRFASQGKWEPFFSEPKDGYDAIEWLAAREWSSGKVGMIGGSYVGWVQLWAASEKPPHLATIIPNVAPPDPFYNIPYEHGTFYIFGSIWWANILESRATADISGQILTRINEQKYEKILRSLPVIELDKKVLGRENPYWRQWIVHNANDDFWQRANFLDKLKSLDLPVFLQSGWFDGDGIGTKLNYLELKKSRNRFQKLIVGPWGHTDQSSSRLGDFDFGPQASIDLRTLYLRWFDRWLKGIDNKITEEPLVQVFVMFSNQWLKSDTYPLPQTVFTRMYLRCGKGANTSRGDGRLLPEPPPSGEKGFDQYTYDPADPTPDPEYNFKSEEEIRKEKDKTVSVEDQREKAKAFHDVVAGSRRDILVYQSEPLKDPLTIAGPVSATLFAASSARDTDWFVSLMDVDEKGKIFSLCRGTVRARFRESTRKPVLLEKNRVYEYTVDLWHTGITFQKGHRIRAEVASAMFPMFSRNLNTGGHNEMETKFRKARQKVLHDTRYPSYLLLPVVKLETE